MNKVQGPTTFVEMWSVWACGQLAGTKLVTEFYFSPAVSTVIVWACGQAERKSEFREACGVYMLKKNGQC